MQWTKCLYPLKICMIKILISSVIGLAGGVLGKWWGHKSGGMRLLPLWKRSWRDTSLLPCEVPVEGTICEPESRLSPDTESVDILSWTFQTPQLWEMQVYCYLVTQIMMFCYSSLKGIRPSGSLNTMCWTLICYDLQTRTKRRVVHIHFLHICLQHSKVKGPAILFL